MLVRRRWCVSGLLSLLLLSMPAMAHKLAPSLLLLQQLSGGEFAVSWKTPLADLAASGLQPMLPTQCRRVGGLSSEVIATGIKYSWKVECSDDLHGQRFAVNGLADNGSSALVMIEWGDDSRAQGILGGDKSLWTVPGRQQLTGVLRQYAGLGVAHILSGVDHLLFVLGLLLLVSNRRLLVATITAFTLGHSVTLALTVLGYVSYPVAVIEFTIAISILFIAIELTRSADERRWLRRRPWLVAMGFGLLHGFGFAGALQEIGLPANHIPTALLAFNMGIETGQLLFVGALLLCRWGWARLSLPGWQGFYWGPVYLLGTLSVCWSLERGLTALQETLVWLL